MNVLVDREKEVLRGFQRKHQYPEAKLCGFPTLGMYKKTSAMGRDIYIETDKLRKAFAIPDHTDSKQAS